MIASAHGRLAGLLCALCCCAAPTQAETQFDLNKLLNTPDWLTLRGEHRTRFETLDNQLRANLGGGDQLLALRTRIKADLDLGPVGFVAELWDARGYFGDAGGSINTRSVNAAEPVQAHLRYRATDLFTSRDSVELLAGRYLMDVGSRRLVGWQRFRNTTNAFTGIKAQWTRGDSTLTAFYTYPNVIRPSDKKRILDNHWKLDDADSDLVFWGAHYQQANPGNALRAELYGFFLNEHDDPNERETRNRDIATFGARLFLAPKKAAVDFDVEGAWQTGHARATAAPQDAVDLDVDAGFVHAEVGYTLDHPWRPRLSLEYDFASGDKDPNDDRAGRFDPLFGPVRFDLAPTGIWALLARANLSAIGARVEAAPDTRSTLFVAWRSLGLAARADSFGNTGVVDPLGRSGRKAGHHVEGVYRRWLIPDTIRMEIGVAALLTGSFFERAPNANGNTDSVYGYAEVLVRL